MKHENLLVREMAERCECLLTDSPMTGSDMPAPLQKEHVQWMCGKIKEHAEDWPLNKLHRWIGFVQAALLANRVLDLDGLKSMFDEAKITYGGTGEDLFDHLDPESSFELDIGGQG